MSNLTAKKDLNTILSNAPQIDVDMGDKLLNQVGYKTTVGGNVDPTNAFTPVGWLSPEELAAFEGGYQGNMDIPVIKDFVSNAAWNPELGQQFANAGEATLENITQRGINAQPQFTKPTAELSNQDFQKVTTELVKNKNTGVVDPDAPGVDPTFFQKMFGWYDKENDIKNTGWFSPTIDAVTGLAQVGLGYKQYKQAGEALDFQKDAFNKNFGMQVEMINRRLEDRERARQLLNGNTKGADQAAKEYVEKYGVKNS